VVGEFDTLEYEVSDRILTVWLSRPPVNALTQHMFREIGQLFRRVESWPGDVRAVILAARGRHFCVGQDLNELAGMTPARAYEINQTARRSLWAIYDCRLPVVGAVHQAAVGGGTALACVCDFVIAAEGAYFGLPEIKVGVGGGGSFVRRIMPMPVARWLFMSGELIPAEQLVQYGTVLDVVPQDVLMERARAACRLMTRHSPVALRMAKEALNRVEYQPLKEGYEFEQGFTAMLTAHPDSKEAARAFTEKREPVYQPFRSE
jgi:enoyl-CoA hydratase